MVNDPSLMLRGHVLRLLADVLGYAPSPLPSKQPGDGGEAQAAWLRQYGKESVHQVSSAWGELFVRLASTMDHYRLFERLSVPAPSAARALVLDLLRWSRDQACANETFRLVRQGLPVPEEAKEEMARRYVEGAMNMADCLPNVLWFDDETFAEFRAELRATVGELLRSSPTATAGGETALPRRAPAETGVVEVHGRCQASESNLEALAIATLMKHPDWSQAEIARAVGVSRQVLYKWPLYQEARLKLARPGRRPRRGHRTPDGRVEAYDEGD